MKKRVAYSMIGIIGLVAVSVLSGILGSYYVLENPERFGFHHAVDTAQQLAQEQTVATQPDLVTVIEHATPSVVSIVITKDVPRVQSFFGTPFDFFFGIPQEGTPESSAPQQERVGGGTGFFVSEEGLIVTNRHVVDDEDASYTVIMTDGTELPVEVLARDTVLDFAVLAVTSEARTEKRFVPLELGDSQTIKIGQTVIAIGNSLGEFSNTVSRGIVSGVQRDIVAGNGFGASEHLTDIIQTDAAINPGNSGGPLLNSYGAVIGINTAVASGAENIGFAIPINHVKQLIADVEATGKIQRPFIGVRYIMLTADLAQELQLPVGDGALVVRGEQITDFAVLPNSPADKAGLRENDVIVEIDGAEVTAEATISDVLREKRPGDILEMRVLRRGEYTTLRVTLEERS